MKRKYTITIEVEYKDPPKGTGDALVKNVQRLVGEMLTVPGCPGVGEWDVKVKKER